MGWKAPAPAMASKSCSGPRLSNAGGCGNMPAIAGLSSRPEYETQYSKHCRRHAANAAAKASSRLRVFRDSASHLANDARSHGKGAVSGSDRHRGGSASVVKDSLAISARSSNGSVTRNGGSAPSVTSSIASDSKYNRSPPAAPSAPGSVSVTRNTRWITSASFDSVELIAAKTPPPRQGTPGEDTAECGEI